MSIRRKKSLLDVLFVVIIAVVTFGLVGFASYMHKLQHRYLHRSDYIALAEIERKLGSGGSGATYVHEHSMHDLAELLFVRSEPLEPEGTSDGITYVMIGQRYVTERKVVLYLATDGDVRWREVPISEDERIQEGDFMGPFLPMQKLMVEIDEE